MVRFVLKTAKMKLPLHDLLIVKATAPYILFDIDSETIIHIGMNVKEVINLEINPTILEAIKNNNNMITTAQAIELGFTRALFSRYVKEGLLERGRRGIYILSDSMLT